MQDALRTRLNRSDNDSGGVTYELGPLSPQPGLFPQRSSAKQERGQPCPRELDPMPGTRGHGCPRSNLESALPSRLCVTAECLT